MKLCLNRTSIIINNYNLLIYKINTKDCTQIMFFYKYLYKPIKLAIAAGIKIREEKI